MPRFVPLFAPLAVAAHLLAAAMMVGALLFAGGPAEPNEFKHARITDAWQAYAKKLSFGKGQTLALVDDGCDLSMPEWSKSDGDQPKVLVSYNSVDNNDDPRHQGRGYHGSTIGIPSSVNYKGKKGVAYNDQLAVIRGQLLTFFPLGWMGTPFHFSSVFRR